MPLLIQTLVDAPAGQAIGINEDLCLHLEKFGDSRVISVEEYIPGTPEKEYIPEQMTLGHITVVKINVLVITCFCRIRGTPILRDNR